MTLTIKDLKYFISSNLDPDDVVEHLEISTDDLLEYMEWKLEDPKIYNRMVKMFSDGRG